MACLRSALKVRMVVVDRFDIEQVKGYTIMPNYHQRDRTLSIKAKGILSQMVQNSEYLIAYVAHQSQGSRELLEYALKRQKRGLIQVTNLSGWYPEI